METKICKKCGVEKKLDEFYNAKRNKDGKWNSCILCEKQKYFESSEQVKLRVSNYRRQNSVKISEKKKEKYFENREKILEQKKKYTKINRENINERIREKYKTDEIFKLISNIRTRVRIFLKTKNLKKNSTTIEILGATPNEVKKYLEEKFDDGMTWENYGMNGWHIDHIVPLSQARNEDEVYKLCHYTNLQPLWAEDNLKKGNKIYI
jgi:predicted transcriptional regulator